MATLIQTLQNTLAGKAPQLAIETRRIILKEVLQAYVLDYIYNYPSYRRLNFYGGTCLHVLYGLNRLSEDLDFDNRADLDLSHLGADLAQHFQQAFAYPQVGVKIQQGAGSIFRTTLKFPLLVDLGLSSNPSEALHLKVEVSQHMQEAVIQHTPLLLQGRSLVAAHFSLETMMAGKMLACLERSFESGRSGVTIKGRDFYDLLWFMQKGIRPLEEKLSRDGRQPYTTRSAILALQEKILRIKPRDLAADLLPMFEERAFITAWLEAFHENFQRLVGAYI
jgi:hypothetical protein